MHERVVVESDKAKVAGRVAEVLGVATAASGTRVRSGEGFRSRAMLKVEDGCDAFCTYCIVPHARGLPRSVARTRVVAEAQALVEAGASEIVLTGINLGRYSDGDTDLPRLIEAVAATGIRRLRLSSIEPLDLTPELLSTLRETAAVCRHLHVPLQSGSDRVLDAMGRGYSVHEFAERIAQARAALPGLAVTTDVIAGFPTETAEEAEETLEFCREMDFAKMHVFRYSLRRGTPAAELPQLAPEVRAMRAEALRRLSSDLRGRHLISQIGAETEVLVERVLPGLAAEGTTRDYVRVRFTAANARPGDVRVVRLREVVEGGLCGDLAE